MLIDPAALKEDLRTNIVELRFTKADGSLRVMRATLIPKYLPPQTEEAEENKQQLLLEDGAPAQSLAVWDIDANDWRSFRFDRLISAQRPNTI